MERLPDSFESCGAWNVLHAPMIKSNGKSRCLTISQPMILLALKFLLRTGHFIDRKPDFYMVLHGRQKSKIRLETLLNIHIGYLYLFLE